jgi:hypothetical protein
MRLMVLVLPLTTRNMAYSSLHSSFARVICAFAKALPLPPGTCETGIFPQATEFTN